MSGNVLQLADRETWQDTATFCSRVRATSPETAIRVAGAGQVAALFTSLRPASGQTLIVGMRTIALAQAWEGDITASAAAWSDRLHARTADHVLAIPVTVIPGGPDLAQSPPRSGWQEAGSVNVTELQQSATDLVAQAASWDSPVLTATTSAPLVSGVAHTAAALGLIPSVAQGVALSVGGARPCPIHTNGRWLRIDCPSGFVLSRGQSAPL